VLRSKWKACKSVFVTRPLPCRFEASVVFDDRYVFGRSHLDGFGFTDKAGYEGWQFPHIVDGDLKKWKNDYDAVIERWMLATNLLTLGKAQRLAEDAMRSAGLDLKGLGFRRPAVKEQMTWTEGMGPYQTKRLEES